MPSRRRRESNLDISLAPFIDVVFLLLCFFVVTTRFDEFNNQSIELPNTSAEQILIEKDFVEISILRSGKVLIGQSVFADVDDAEIATILFAFDRNKPVLIKADKYSSHGDVVTIMDLVTQVGFSSISIASVGKEP